MTLELRNQLVRKLSDLFYGRQEIVAAAEAGGVQAGDIEFLARAIDTWAGIVADSIGTQSLQRIVSYARSFAKNVNWDDFAPLWQLQPPPAPADLRVDIVQASAEGARDSGLRVAITMLGGSRNTVPMVSARVRGLFARWKSVAVHSESRQRHNGFNVWHIPVEKTFLRTRQIQVTAKVPPLERSATLLATSVSGRLVALFSWLVLFAFTLFWLGRLGSIGALGLASTMAIASYTWPLLARAVKRSATTFSWERAFEVWEYALPLTAALVLVSALVPAHIVVRFENETPTEVVVRAREKQIRIAPGTSELAFGEDLWNQARADSDRFCICGLEPECGCETESVSGVTSHKIRCALRHWEAPNRMVSVDDSCNAKFTVDDVPMHQGFLRVPYPWPAKWKSLEFRAGVLSGTVFHVLPGNSSDAIVTGRGMRPTSSVHLNVLPLELAEYRLRFDGEGEVTCQAAATNVVRVRRTPRAKSLTVSGAGQLKWTSKWSADTELDYAILCVANAQKLSLSDTELKPGLVLDVKDLKTTVGRDSILRIDDFDAPLGSCNEIRLIAVLGANLIDSDTGNPRRSFTVRKVGAQDSPSWDIGIVNSNVTTGFTGAICDGPSGSHSVTAVGHKLRCTLTTAALDCRKASEKSPTLASKSSCHIVESHPETAALGCEPERGCKDVTHRKSGNKVTEVARQLGWKCEQRCICSQ
jgi:hypothetical protein